MATKRKTEIRLKKGSGIRKSNPREELLDEALIGRAICECLRNGDSPGVVEVIQIYLTAVLDILPSLKGEDSWSLQTKFLIQRQLPCR